MAIDVDSGTPAPLEVQLPESDGSKGVKAYLTRVEDQADLGAVVLDHVGRGTYLATFVPATPGTVHATFIVYTDDNFTEEDALYPYASELYLVAPAGGRARYDNRMSTAYNQQTRAQEIIVWSERNGIVVAGANCRISIKDGLGAEIYSASQAAPNSDGVFLFQNTEFSARADTNYYIKITTAVDGADRTSFQSFFTVG